MTVEQVIIRFWENLIGRVGGPLTFRLMLQPIMVAIIAVRAGLKDAREGRPPYTWAVFTDPVDRGKLLRDGWKAVGKVFVLAVIIDILYQVVVHQWFYPLETLIVGAILALLPYLVIRGPVNRIARRWHRGNRKLQ
ncbi:MAG: hypothetical protein ACLP29_02135 [Dissulfurispiraceae bacterium]